MYKAIIFDLDGTLVDTLKDLQKSINEALKTKGYPFSYNYEESKMLIGSGTKNLCRRALKKIEASEQDIESLFQEFTFQYNQRQLDEAKPFKGINELVLALKQDGISLCVLSNKVEENTRHILDSLFPKNTFTYIQGQRKDVPLKPDPTGVNLLIARLQLPKNEILYIGDSDVDMQTAINAGLTKIAVGWGYRSKEILLEKNPDFFVENPKEILDIVKMNQKK